MTNPDVLAGLVATVPTIVAQHTREHGRCVLASRVGFDVLRSHGIAAEPIAVQLAAMNQAYLAWAERRGTLDDW